MVDYIYRYGPSVLSFGKSVQSYKNFLTYANKTQKIAVICVFLIISPIFMSSSVHYLCPPPSISRAILLPALHPPFRLCPPPSIVRHFLFLHPPCMADRKCRLLYCLFVSSPLQRGAFSSFVPAESWLLISLFIFLVIHFPCNHCYIIVILLLFYWVVIGLLLGYYWVTIG